MHIRPRQLFFLFFAFAFASLPAVARPPRREARPRGGEARLVLSHGWALASSANVPSGGAEISRQGFETRGWYPALKMPGTVLATLVRDRIYPNPDFGTNLRKVPGTTYPIGGNFANLPMPGGSPFAVGWWYRSTFSLPARWRGRQLWLHFNGINYRARIWMNGEKIAASSQVQGTWRTWRFNVTRFARAGAENCLAVEVFAPTPDDLGITFVDWNPLPADKDMGIFRQVYFTATGPVAIEHPQVETRFDLPSLAVAHLTVSATLRNASSSAVSGRLRLRLAGRVFSQTVRLEPGRSRRVVFRPARYRGLNLPHPRVWWPWIYGKQPLYQAHFAFLSGRKISDRRQVTFGVRQATSYVDSSRHRVFEINGRRILIRGGGWSPDMLLRLKPRRTLAELEYLKAINLNAVRLEGKPMNQRFYRICDRLGILVLQGWCCCSRWEHWNDWRPVDYKVAAGSLRDQVRRLRNHASLLAYLYGSDNAAPPRVERMYLGVFKKYHWPNPTVAAASARKTTVGWTGVKMTGPYQYVAPSYWSLDTHHGGAYGFNTETSPGPAIPLRATLRSFLPADQLWPINDTWLYHAGGGQFKNLHVYNHALDERYGKPAGFDDYVETSQLVAYEGERAMFEAYGEKKYVSTGVIQWMLNNAWPSLIWHLFDYDLRPGGGYFGTREACQPIHIQYDYDTNSVSVVNSRLVNYPRLRAEAEIYTLNLQRRFHRVVNLRSPADSAKVAIKLPTLTDLTPTYFLRLRLIGAGGIVLSRNFYWLSTQPDVFDWPHSTWYYTPLSGFANLRGLRQLPRTRVRVQLVRRERVRDQDYLQVVVSNPSPRLAFFLYLKVLRGAQGGDLRPLFWSDNYITLMPHARRRLTVHFAAAALGRQRPVVEVSGWNVPATYAR